MDLPLSDFASYWFAPDASSDDARPSEAAGERPVDEAWADLEERVSAARAIL